jgi:hypothetical protein
MTGTHDRFNAFLDLPEVPVPNAQSGSLTFFWLGRRPRNNGSAFR